MRIDVKEFIIKLKIFIKLMRILAIETSCDETAVSLINNERILANEMYSQTTLHINDV